MTRKNKDEQELKQQARQQWAKAYSEFGTEKKEEKPKTVIDNKSAVNIVTRGINLGETKLVKALDWILIADVILMFSLLAMGLWEMSEKLSFRMLGIDLIAFGWFMVDVTVNSFKAFENYAYNIPAAVNRFGNKSFSEKMYKQNQTAKLVYFADEERKNNKVAELRSSLAKKIVTKIALPVILMTFSAGLLLGMTLYMNKTQAFIYGGVGLLAGIAYLLVVYFILKNRK